MNDNIIWHNGATGGYTAFTGFVKGTQKGVVVLTNSTSDVNDIGLKLLNPTSNLTMPKKSIAKLLQQEIDANGIEKGIALYDSLKKKNDGNYNFEEGELNRLGYDYLNNEKIAIAIALFKKNVAEFPKASNPYDSLGEAYLKNGDTELAIANYTKSVQLNPANTNGIEALKKMGIDTNTILPEVRLSETVLERYVGTYELTPTFLITITRKDDQLFGQATGQNQFELFPRNETKFYLKIVEASITFSVNNKNETVSLTLHQGGFDQKAKKIK
ncbi:MAG: DUF3471 domain-containing protein [Flavobacteriaceae bacterium]|nr:DUF3471 domain-containing protein [Flavobacteriaceae bacterium]